MQEGVVIVSAGPSLRAVNPYAAGWPIAVVSTAIRSVPDPDLWFLTDDVSQQHGPEGPKAVQNESIMKIIPAFKGYQNVKNVTRIPYNRSKGADGDREFADGQLPLLRSEHYSFLLAIQVLVYWKFNLLIFCGLDLKVEDRDHPYAYKAQPTQHDRNSLDRLIERVYPVLKAWTAIANRKGIEFVDWSPGSRLHELGWPQYKESDHGSIRRDRQRPPADDAGSPQGKAQPQSQEDKGQELRQQPQGSEAV